MEAKLVVGDRVGYARKFLKSIGAGPTDESWKRKGTVTAVKNYPRDVQPVIQVHWDDGTDGGALESALAKLGSVAYID